MTLNDKLKRIAAELGGIGVEIYHYHRPQMSFPCVVWAEESGDELRADNGAAEQALGGTLDYFTQEEFDPTVDLIQEALQALGFSWALNSVQYEQETELIHYEWIWGAA